MAEFTRLPLGLLPILVVPVVLSSTSSYLISCSTGAGGAHHSKGLAPPRARTRIDEPLTQVVSNILLIARPIAQGINSPEEKDDRRAAC